ncbi:MAG: carbohydrate-binding domain-containing protein [Anaeroplasmataceae bacterium]
MKKILLFSMLLVLGLCSCSITKGNTPAETYNPSDGDTTTIGDETETEEPVLTPPEASASSDYDATKDIIINMSSSTTVDNNNGYVCLEDNVIWILGEGLYTLTGNFHGSVIVSAPDAEVEITLNNATITSSNSCPLLIYEASKCEISAKVDTINKVEDLREESTGYNAAIYATCDLKLKGKGSLTVTNKYNNGVHTKDDLEIKNLSLNVTAVNNALKGNDSLTIESGNIVAISTKGDSLKTDNSDISSKGNQRGTITISGGSLDLYAACDCIDASYDVLILNNPVINCYTDSYSNYSEEVSATSASTLYLRISSTISSYRYAILYTLDNNETKFVNATAISSMGGPRRETYLSLDKPSNAVALTVYAYSSTTTTNSTVDYLYKSECVSVNTSYDCLNVSKASDALTLSWSTYTTMQGPGGMNPGGGIEDGNPDKSDYSCKGIKADNIINISGGTITIKSHDDAIHANGDVTLENGSVGLGNVLISGGVVSIYCDDDGIHADNILTIDGGVIDISNSYEGIEANIININGGTTSLISSDDGVNASYFNQTPSINITGGVLYLNASGDGLDSNGNIVMTGGYVLAIGPTNSGNGVLDYDGSFKATGGYLLAIGASGMNQSVTASGSAKSSTKTISTSVGSYVALNVDGEDILIIKVLKSSQNYCVYSYTGSSATVSVSTSTDKTLVNDLYYVK